MDNKISDAYNEVDYITDTLKDIDSGMCDLTKLPEGSRNTALKLLDDMYNKASALEDIFWKAGFYDEYYGG